MPLVLRIGGMFCKQVTLHHGDADTQEEQQDGDGAGDDPPEVWMSQRHKEKEAPPEEHFAKVVRMARGRP